VTESKVLRTLQPGDTGYDPGSPYVWTDAEGIMSDPGVVGLLDNRFTGGQPGQLVSTLRRGKASAVLNILGDSTGNETFEWAYRLSVWLGQQFPAYTVLYRLWDDTAQAYGTATTLQTGTGAQTLTVYNGSVPGMGYNYPFGSVVPATRFNLMLPVSPTAVIISYGYNSATADYRKAQLELASWVLGNFPGTEYVLTSQPPMATTAGGAANQLTRMQDTRNLAAQERWGLIDVTQRFLDYGNYDALINADTVHPLVAGQDMWVEELQRYFSGAAQRQVPTTAPATIGRIFVPAQVFSLYSGTPAMTFPAGVITPKWDFDPAADEMIATIVDIPPTWKSVNVDLLWVSPIGATGDVSWQVDNYSLTPDMVPQSGKQLASATAGTPFTATVAPNAARVSRMYSAERFAGGRPVAFRVRRLATSGADTSTQDASVFGLLITRAE
jgi:hypothetical protein